MKQELKINLKPSKSDFLELENWLIDEYNKFDEGFYCNWNIIKDSYKNNEVITLCLNDKIIGFVDWSQDENVIHINIMEIHPDYRKMGLGKKFLAKLEAEFKEHGNIAIVLFCEPRESEHFWRKMEFIKFPNRGWSESDLTFYKPLINVLKSNHDIKNENMIELWNVEPYQSNKFSPEWSWSIETENEKLITPIIQPCNRNWNVRWTMNGKVIKEDKVKYFSNDFTIENGPFMFIEKLK
ncbi:MAG: GNAT family N-acetyltransferase [Bacteroidales bacterium]|nr:GNAT family N-acetyltransferase [Bacteroidales bacterium]